MRMPLKIALVTGIVALLNLTSGSYALAQQIEIDRDNRTIAVSATDSAASEADTAAVHIGFQSFAADEKAAYATGSRISNAIARALGEAGVKKDAIESNEQSIDRVQPDEVKSVSPDQKHPLQFVVRQSWTVKASAKEAANVLNTAVQAGANQSGDIAWDVLDPDALEAHAASKAMKSAQQIATRMAEGLGGRLGPLLYASNQVPFSARNFVSLETQSSQINARSAEAPVAPLAIKPKRVTRSATVYAVFAIE